ncbi:MAG: hypothetical protein HY800_05610 [Ignavibacteriales bacterium]|nr:hypothetical protein [Ignavibacteriales bacterium]
MTILNKIQQSLNKVSRRAFYTTVIVVLLINGLILFFFIKGSLIIKRHEEPNFDGFRYGQIFNKNKILELCSLSSMTSKFKLLVAFPNQNRKSFLRELSYLDLLYQKYVHRGLLIVCIVNATEYDLVERYRKRLNLSLPLINDSSDYLTDLFNIKNNNGGLLMIDESDTIRFVFSSFLNEHMIRQLVESEVLGYNKIVFSKEEFDTQLKPATHIGYIRLYDLKTNEDKRLKDILLNRMALLTLVDPTCYFCKGESARVETLNKMFSLFPERLDLIYIYKASTPFHEAKKFLNEKKYTGQYFFSSDIILAESEYCTIAYLKKPTTSILVNHAADVVYFESIDDDEESMLKKVINIVSTKFEYSSFGKVK